MQDRWTVERKPATKADAPNRLLAAIRMPSVAARCEDELTKGLERWPDLAFAIVSHADGRPFAASALRANAMLPKLSAQIRSLLATSDVIAKDAGGGKARHVLVEMVSDVFVTVKVPETEELLVLSVSSATANGGLALHAAQDIAGRVSAVVAAFAPRSSEGTAR